MGSGLAQRGRRGDIALNGQGAVRGPLPKRAIVVLDGTCPDLLQDGPRKGGAHAPCAVKHQGVRRFRGGSGRSGGDLGDSGEQAGAELVARAHISLCVEKILPKEVLRTGNATAAGFPIGCRTVPLTLAAHVKDQRGQGRGGRGSDLDEALDLLLCGAHSALGRSDEAAAWARAIGQAPVCAPVFALPPGISTIENMHLGMPQIDQHPRNARLFPKAMLGVAVNKNRATAVDTQALELVGDVLQIIRQAPRAQRSVPKIEPVHGLCTRQVPAKKAPRPGVQHGRARREQRLGLGTAKKKVGCVGPLHVQKTDKNQETAAQRPSRQPLGGDRGAVFRATFRCVRLHGVLRGPRFWLPQGMRLRYNRGVLSFRTLEALVPRIFVSQRRIQQWAEEGRSVIDGNTLNLPELGRPFRLLEAFHVERVVSESGDPYKLTGRAKTRAQIGTLGGEVFLNSLIIGDVAYEGEPGFIGEALPTTKQAPPPAPAPSAGRRDGPSASGVGPLPSVRDRSSMPGIGGTGPVPGPRR